MEPGSQGVGANEDAEQDPGASPSMEVEHSREAEPVVAPPIRSGLKRERSASPESGKEPSSAMNEPAKRWCCCCPRCCVQKHTAPRCRGLDQSGLSEQESAGIQESHSSLNEPVESGSEDLVSLEEVSSETESGTDLEEYDEEERAGLAAVNAVKRALLRHETIVSLCVTLLRGSDVLSENAKQTSAVEEWFRSHRVINTAVIRVAEAAA